jgi:hypothetical protein
VKTLASRLLTPAGGVNVSRETVSGSSLFHVKHPNSIVTIVCLVAFHVKRALLCENGKFETERQI